MISISMKKGSFKVGSGLAPQRCGASNTRFTTQPVCTSQMPEVVLNGNNNITRYTIESTVVWRENFPEHPFVQGSIKGQRVQVGFHNNNPATTHHRGILRCPVTFTSAGERKMDERATESPKVFDLDNIANTHKASNLPATQGSASWRSPVLATGPSCCLDEVVQANPNDIYDDGTPSALCAGQF